MHSVPDLAATVHAVTGGTLPTSIGDLDVVDSTPMQEDATTAYIFLFRGWNVLRLSLWHNHFRLRFSDKALSKHPSCSSLRGDVPKEEPQETWGRGGGADGESQ